MTKVIIYDDVCEVLNIEEILKCDIEIIGYLKNDDEYFGEFINEIEVYTLNNIREKIRFLEFDYIIVNSRCSEKFYNTIKECGVLPEKILDICFLNYDYLKKSFKDKLLYCKNNDISNFDIMFLGRNYIGDNVISKYFNDCVNISNKFLDIHYDYHILYYFIKNNKISQKNKIGIFIDYSMLYENIDLSHDKNDFINVFEEVFSVHNNVNKSNTYFGFCYDNFKKNFEEIFDVNKIKDLNCLRDFNISKDEIKKIKYDSYQETINYRESNVVAFKMNKNILLQKIKLLYENNIDMFFIIPPVHKEFRTYINNILRKEFYTILNKGCNEKLYVFDYFKSKFDDKYFCSPTKLNYEGSLEFLKILSYDVKNKFSCVKICNNL